MQYFQSLYALIWLHLVWPWVADKAHLAAIMDDPQPPSKSADVWLWIDSARTFHTTYDGNFDEGTPESLAAMIAVPTNYYST